MSLSALSVMVVEDHGFQRRMALRLLSELGIGNVHQAADGVGALGQLDDMGSIPDVVLVDLDMPGMDGIEFIGHLAQRRLARAVVVVSALDPALLNTVQTMARAYGLRVLGSVEKPLTLEKLSAALEGFSHGLLDDADDEPIEITASSLREALSAGRIGPWYQPQVEFANGHVVGVEALARWVEADGRVIAPSHFVPLLEREGLLEALTDHMLTQACRDKRRWDEQGLDLTLSVNVSPTSLTLNSAADRYQRLVEAEGIDPADVILEITESSVMADAARGLGVMARLRLKGFGLSIDDFGTGWSSLAQLSQVPFTELKIDQTFVTGAHKQPRKRAVVEASLDLARKLDLKVVAEGVETIDDWQMLADLGCGIAQGSLVSLAVPATTLPDVVAHWRRPGH